MISSSWNWPKSRRRIIQEDNKTVWLARGSKAGDDALWAPQRGGGAFSAFTSALKL